MGMKCVIYARVSTEEQNPKSQLQVVLGHAATKGYEVVRIFEENISGSVNPFRRPVFRKMLDYIRENGVGVVVMYDLTRFYRASSPTDALNKLRILMDEYRVFVDFAREPVIEDPLLRELWMFIKSWFATYERLQASIRTKYGMIKAKNEGRLYHRPSIVHYYAAWIFNKDLGDLTDKEIGIARKQLVAIVKRYWDGRSVKRSKIGEVLMEHELREMYVRFPKAPRNYLTFLRLMKREKSAMTNSKKKHKQILN